LKKIDFSRFLIDTSHVRAVGGGAHVGGRVRMRVRGHEPLRVLAG
jgi:hypothetical protein